MKKGRLSLHRSPSAEELYEKLRSDADLRLKVVEGQPYAAALDKGAVLLLPVPSKDFFEFVDSFQVARGQRVAKPKALQALSDLIARITSSPGFHDELPLGSRGKDWGGARPLLDRELGDSNAVRSRPTVKVEPVLPVDLADLKVKTKPEYVERTFWGLTDLEIMRRAYRSGQAVLLTGPPGPGRQWRRGRSRSRWTSRSAGSRCTMASRATTRSGAGSE